jgi:hypothetical protein
MAMSLAAVAAGLFFVYLLVSRTSPENSDEANILFMASDMLHGNVMLQGWVLSDVSFFTTELPQYALLEHVFGLRAETAHIAAAMTYTLVVMLAAALAAGRRAYVPAAERPVRAVVTAGIMIAPQLGVGVFILLLSVGHIGTAVPLMLTWLVIDRASPSAAARPSAVRLWEAPLVAVLLAWPLVADRLVLVAGVIPLVLVCLVRSGQAFGWPRRGSWRPWLRGGVRGAQRELMLIAAAGAAYGLAAAAEWLLRRSGAFTVLTVVYKLAPVTQWPGHAWVAFEGWLALFGARPGGSWLENVFALLHLAGVALVLVAMYQVARRFLRGADLIDQVLLAAIVINVLLYVPSVLGSTTDLNTREFAVALPFGAVLAARTLAPAILHSLPRYARLRAGERRTGRHRWAVRRAWAVPALSAVLAAYLASLGFAAVQPEAPPANQQLATWLAAHDLTYGISGYWQASIVTVETGGQVTIRAVYPGNLQRDWWESKHSWYDPSVHAATFLVTQDQPGFYNLWEPEPAAVAAFGRPASTYEFGPYTIYVWDQNLLK